MDTAIVLCPDWPSLAELPSIKSPKGRHFWGHRDPIAYTKAAHLAELVAGKTTTDFLLHYVQQRLWAAQILESTGWSSCLYYLLFLSRWTLASVSPAVMTSQCV